jgi:hypothetical protein
MTQAAISAHPLRRVSIAGAVVMLMAFISACGQRNHSASSGTIIVERQRSLAAAAPTAIAAMASGGFAIAGKGGGAWAGVTDSTGSLLWEFRDREPGIKPGQESSFAGVVQLANGKILFCGSKSSAQTGGNGLITIFSASGAVVEQRLMKPNGDATFFDALFSRCLKWNDGYVLVGRAAKRDLGGYGWLVKLDKDGTKEWEVVGEDIPGASVAEMSDHNLLIGGGHELESRLAIVNSRGETIARRTISNGGYTVVLAALQPAPVARVLIYGSPTQSLALYALNSSLGDATPPVSIRWFDVTQGRGYVRSDNSLALFGKTRGAAVAWISQDSKPIADTVFDDRFKSFTVADAIPISNNEFVAVRLSVSQAANDQGIVLSWVKFD